MERKVRIVLHGRLKELYPDELVLSGNSVSELIHGMCRVTKAFNPMPFEGRHSISVVGYETEESLYSPLAADVEEIHLVPTMFGGKKGGLFQIVLGVVLIGLALWIGPPALAGSFAWGGTGGILFSMGVSLALGGLMAMLSPAPTMDSSGNSAADPEASKYLGATGNTVKIGTRIPLMYGLNKAYGHYISFDVDAKDVDPSTL